LNVESFVRLAELLTGTPVKELTERDRDCLATILADDQRPIRCSQFNELLLLVNKDRVTDPFFRHFFGEESSVGEVAAGVEKFQKIAMLCFGNFIYAFRTLARIDQDADLRRKLGDFGRKSEDVVGRFSNRSTRLLDVDSIPRADTPFVGYLSGTETLAELERARFLRDRLPARDQWANTDWSAFETQIQAAVGEQERLSFLSLLARYRARYPGQVVAAFAEHLPAVIADLEGRDARIQAVRAKAIRNLDVYLTWDHMDVYFATSMRKRWEFEDLFDFVHGVMNQKTLEGLNLRYFDPTQAFTDNRVNKGLVESLMLKRARCTVYSVQDTDTLGKDSELAATLAQGKPVIAFVPTIDVEGRVRVLREEDPSTIQDRLRFVLYADDAFAASLSANDLKFVREFGELDVFEGQRIWRSLPDPDLVAQLRQAHGNSIERLCRIIAQAEARVYDRRARTLRHSHPLAIQVNLDTGVANGVLAVRTIEDCAKLLRCVLTNTMDFDLVENGKDRMWYLNERISGCPYRVVSKDRKLTNCFWNFYRNPVG
jgi:hypothetical protein